VIPQPVLVTGGAGFIGSHLVAALRARGLAVRVLDRLDAQVHGAGARAPQALPRDVEFRHGSVTDRRAVEGAVDGVRAVVHLAAAVGVGQSMYDIAAYVEANSGGTAVLLDALAGRRPPVDRLVVASSMSIYGEGRYRCPACGPIAPGLRPVAQLEARRWELSCPACGGPAAPTPTDEEQVLRPTSVYAVTKRDQEELALCVGRAYGIPTVALRLFNVYGPGQSLSNPYTGVAAIFASRLRNGQPPVIFEDGGQTRDFVHVQDVVAAFCLALERPQVTDVAVNVGTGQATSVLEVAGLLGKALGVATEPEIVGKFREGDVRHCIADIERARRLLGFAPRMALADGIPDLARWAGTAEARDRVAVARAELEKRGLVR
jgi:dTDP-L-rhamnose 4-epimerase